MPTAVNIPDKVRSYVQHGLDLTYQAGKEECPCECPFCGTGGGKFGVRAEDGAYNCFVCGEAGGPTPFIRRVWEMSTEKNGHVDTYRSLASERGLLSPQTLIDWGVTRGIITGEWLVPAYGPGGKIDNLYIYRTPLGGKKPVLQSTAGFEHAIYGVNLFDREKKIVYVCEGPWDAMVLWELLKRTKRTDEGLAPTGNEKVSMLTEANVIAVPGANVFKRETNEGLSWSQLFAGKTVILLYDSDPPKNGKPGAGIAGMQKAAQVLASMMNGPEKVWYLNWGKEGYDADLPAGYDVRDLLTQGTTLADRVQLLPGLIEKLAEVPLRWIEGVEKGGIDLLPLKCTDYKTLQNAWRKALKFKDGDGLDRALSVMLSCVTSTKSVGDQLWCKIIGPASCGKSTLCEALTVSKKYVKAVSTLRGFHSGFKVAGGEDTSIIPQIDGKTMVIKDGDTLVRQPNLEQILSEARDLYDTTARTNYRNKISRNYNGVRFTWILCGTGSLHVIDSSELGERFVDCVIMDGIDDEFEDEVLWRVVNRANRNMAQESNCQATSQYDPSMVEAMRLTGGYVEYLRNNAQRLLEAVEAPEDSLMKCARYGKFVAHLRARPSQLQEETSEREMAARLATQMVRLAKCLAVVLNRDSLNPEVMSRVRQVALDTARGRTMEIVKLLYAAGAKGLDKRVLAAKTGETDNEMAKLLKFLRAIKVVDVHEDVLKVAGGGAIKQKPKWKLTERMCRMYRDVVETR